MDDRLVRLPFASQVLLKRVAKRRKTSMRSTLEELVKSLEHEVNKDGERDGHGPDQDDPAHGGR